VDVCVEEDELVVVVDDELVVVWVDW